MKAVIVYRKLDGELEGGIYYNTTYAETAENVGKHNILDYIPLTVSGIGYKARKTDLENKAIEWSYASSLYEWSFGELATVSEFFEVNGKRYGMLKEFRENAIC